MLGIRQHSALSSHPAWFLFCTEMQFQTRLVISFIGGMSIYSPAAGSNSRVVKYLSAQWPSASHPRDGSAHSAQPPSSLCTRAAPCIVPRVPPFPCPAQSSPVIRRAGGQEILIVPNGGNFATAPAPCLDSVYLLAEICSCMSSPHTESGGTDGERAENTPNAWKPSLLFAAKGRQASK